MASFDPKGHHMNEIDKGLQRDAPRPGGSVVSVSDS